MLLLAHFMLLWWCCWLVVLDGYNIIDLTIGLRVKEDECEGLDTTSHGERADNL
jgi:ammonia channel protein AmtB